MNSWALRAHPTWLQTLSVIAGEKSSTIVFPVPMDFLTPFLDMLKKNK